MRKQHPISALVVSLALLLNCIPYGFACGPEEIQPIFVFKNSPDPPFDEYVRGKLGILLPTMGNRTLFIGYRYVNGGSFTGTEQRGLIEALHGKAPEDKGEDAIKAWIEARKAAGSQEEKLPAIYSERQYGGYDFFPNCTRSGFETAIETLNDRTTAYGKEDPNVRAWLVAQDKVFQNCAGGASIPQELGPDSPEWLRKDRDYQIAAAYFYSLNFDQAHDRFQIIAADNLSPWRETADYLVARTLVRKASLTNDAATKQAIYEQAERHLLLLVGGGGKFLNASKKLLGLVNYRLRPEQRVRELAQILSHRNGNDNLRQDLIDYVWLIEKFDAQVKRAERARKDALKGIKENEEWRPDPERKAVMEAVSRGELIEINFSPRLPDGGYDYKIYVSLSVKYDTPEAEILEAVVQSIGRKLTEQEIEALRETHQRALEHRLWLLAPNRMLDKATDGSYQGVPYYYSEPKDAPSLEQLPAFVREDDLSDWVLTFQSTDPKSYAHALSKWQETNSITWLLVAMSKAEKDSTSLDRLLIQAEKVPRNSAAYLTVTYHLIRLNQEFGKQAEARMMLDEILTMPSDLLPASALNQFLELGTKLASGLDEFLRFGQRKPAAFYLFGTYGTINDFRKLQKTFRYPENSEQTKEEFEQQVDEQYKKILDYDNRLDFDEKTIDVFNTHFPVAVLADVGHHPALPDYLHERVLLAAWTRSILLKDDKISKKVAAQLVTHSPRMETIFASYLEAKTVDERNNTALIILLRSPGLSPYVIGGVPTFLSAEESDYYFELSWWCTPSDTDYDIYGNEFKKIIPKPGFLSLAQLNAARKEHAMLVTIGNAKSYLGEKAIAWAKRSPGDSRIPEALYIAVEANRTYKYGCGGWEMDEQIMSEAETILRNRYPDSPWTAKVSKNEN